VPDFKPYQLTAVPRLPVESSFAAQFMQQMGTSLVTTVRELAPRGILPSDETALDLRKVLGLRDREQLQEFEKALVTRGTPIAPRVRAMSPMTKALIALGLFFAFR